MFKKSFLILLICILLSLCIVGIIIFKDMQDSKQIAEGSTTEETQNNTQQEQPEETTKEEIAEEEQVELNPFGGEEAPEDMTIELTLEYIHHMSHQKVVADVKWGFFEITDERIHWLLDAVEQSNFPQKEQYEDLLNRWAKGDFSQIVEDHNFVWRLQDGTIGKATGILSKEEEEAYILENR